MKLYSTILFSVFLIFSLMAQENISRPYVTQDSAVDTLLSSFRSFNRNEGMQGFRIQIFTASGNRSKLLTERQKAEFNSTFPGIRSYITYDEPYYKLRVGDFRTRLDAEGFMRTISSKYIYAMVVPDKINLPQLDKDDSTEFIDNDKEE